MYLKAGDIVDVARWQLSRRMSAETRSFPSATSFLPRNFLGVSIERDTRRDFFHVQHLNNISTSFSIARRMSLERKT